jgi:hypothetical protein
MTSCRAIAPPVLKHLTSTIVISHESDVVQALPLSKASGDKNVPQPKAGTDHNIPQNQMAPFEVAQQFMEAIRFTKTHWPIIVDEINVIIDEAWKLAIES